MAGVTHSTVSRALRNSPLVNRETVEKIQRIAREAGYRTSAAARSLVTAAQRHHRRRCDQYRRSRLSPA